MTGPPSRSRRVALALSLVGMMLVVGAALARSSSALPYPFEEVWPTAIRFLRVDRGATLREKDSESGYVLFDLPEGGKTYKGSLELIRITDPEGRDATRVASRPSGSVVRTSSSEPFQALPPSGRANST